MHERTRELRNANSKLVELATTDPLTGLCNRRAFSDSFERLYNHAVERRSDLAVLMMDLDGFKPVNDKLGHDTGDELLKLTANTLRENCRSYDVAARLGGDEFVVLMPQVDEATAETVANQILEQFQARTTELLEGNELISVVSMSIGLSFLKRHAPDNREHLINLADKALYSAKGSGKACLVIYHPGKVAA